MNLQVIDNHMVPIYQDDQQDRFVDARELHEFLECKRQFANWIHDRIEKYGFVEGEDFLTTLLKIHDDKPGRPRKEYFLTLDTAKEIAMLENNEKGRQIRKYFIEVEKRFREIQTIQPQSQFQPWADQAGQHLSFAKQLAQVTGVREGIAFASALEEAERETGRSLEAYKRLLPPAEHETGYLTPTDLGNRFSLSARKINKHLERLGLQEKRPTKKGKEWRLTVTGKEFGEEFPYIRNGHSGYQIRWSEKVIDRLETELGHQANPYTPFGIQNKPNTKI